MAALSFVAAAGFGAAILPRHGLFDGRAGLFNLFRDCVVRGEIGTRDTTKSAGEAEAHAAQERVVPVIVGAIVEGKGGASVRPCWARTDGSKLNE